MSTDSISSTDIAVRRLAAEAMGTAFLLATVVGSGIMAERLAGGPTDSFSGIAPLGVPPFIAAQLLGAAAAGFFVWLLKPLDNRDDGTAGR